MNKILLFCLLFSGLWAHGQKETAQTIDAQDLKVIVISADEIFRITLSTAPVESIEIRTRSDGEYYNRISLDAEIQGETLVLNSRFREILESGYDKLSAHKVFAMEIILVIPDGLSVDISSNLASVYASGSFENLLIQLRSGSCYLSRLSSDAVVNTFNGNIELEAINSLVTASSRHGEVQFTGQNSGERKVELSSINGNIRVVNTK